MALGYDNIGSHISCRWHHLVTESRRWYATVLLLHLIPQQSLLESKINDRAAKSHDVGRVLHANASTGSGIQGKRVLRSEEAIQKDRGVIEDTSKV